MIRYLRKLLSFWGKSEAQSDSNPTEPELNATDPSVSDNPEPKLSADIGPDENISRFLTSTSHFSKTKGRIKYNAFLPAQDGDTSVYRTLGLSSQEISNIGEEYVRQPGLRNGRSVNIYGWAEVKARAVIKDTDIDILPEPTPHLRHANLTNWPDDNSKRKMQAVILADYALYHPNS
ncbi:MAG: hypothetical protein GY808_15840 [Gammaproteobacteria bacterium]|nr:hypothetical protein [Gammaproteobacteria bacterium]